MSRHLYYEDLKALAREKRALYGVDTATFRLKELRSIYRAEGIRITPWPLPRKIKAVYMCSDGMHDVAIQEGLPYEPKLFALVHELKHHYRDQTALICGVMSCGDYNENELIEKGAEVFAAEFIYPEEEFAADLIATGICVWTAEAVVHFKRSCKAKVSYRYICKRLERLNLVPVGAFSGVKFQNLEDKLYGVPYHRRRFRRAS